MIKIRSLVKKYGDHIAVDNLTLDINENEVFGLLGSNGAGKTTIIHMLATLLKPFSGSATVNGYDIVCQPAKVRSSIGIVFQAPSSDDMLTGYENLQLHSMLYSIPRHTRKQRIDEVFKAWLGGDIIRIKTHQSPDEISRLDFVHKVEQNNGFLVLSVNNAKRDLPILLRHIEADMAEFTSPTLNDVFIHLTGRNIKEEPEGGFSEKYAKYD